MGAGKLFQAFQQGVVVKTIFGHVAHKHGRLGCDQAQGLEQGLLFAAQVQNASGFAFEQAGLHPFEHLEHGRSFLVVAGFGRLGVALQGFFDCSQISQA